MMIIFYPAERNMEYGPHPALVVRNSNTHGLGVYTREALPAGTVVERCAILVGLSKLGDFFVSKCSKIMPR